MTDIEKKALALVNEVTFGDEPWTLDDVRGGFVFKALCRAIEQHEAFRQEVSDAIQSCMLGPVAEERLSPFIIPKPDPVQDAIHELGKLARSISSDDLRAALAARGLEVRKIGEGE